jgi:hypothetical protein
MVPLLMVAVSATSSCRQQISAARPPFKACSHEIGNPPGFPVRYLEQRLVIDQPTIWSWWGVAATEPT